MDIVLVGHGPSINCRIGDVIDAMRVVRVKRAIPDGCRPEHFGRRCDYLLARNREYLPAGVAFWHYPDAGWPAWNEYFLKFSNFRKYSHGLAAAFAAMDNLSPDRLFVIGYDRLMGRYATGKAWAKADLSAPPSEHDWPAERAALAGLGVPIFDLSGLTTDERFLRI